MSFKLSLTLLAASFPLFVNGVSEAGMPLPVVWDPVDSARVELEAGRFWHAARILEGIEDPALEPGELFLLAQARAGFWDWDGVLAILDGAQWLDEEDGGLAWATLARALEEAERWGDAADAYGSAEALGDEENTRVWMVRHARALVRAEQGSSAADLIDRLAQIGPELASWAGRELARSLASEGDTASVGRLLGAITTSEASVGIVGTWASALLNAGDTAAAVRSYRAAVDSVPDARAADFLDLLGRVALAKADTAEAIATFKRSLQLAAPGAAVGASARLQDLGSLSESELYQAARALRTRNGMAGRAVAAYDAYFASLDGLADHELLFDRAKLLAGISSRQNEAIEAFRELNELDIVPALGARLLEAWADLRRSQGETAAVRTLRVWLLDRYPESPEAVEVAFLRADAAQDRGEVQNALDQYANLQLMNPTLDRAGLGRMRTAQLYLGGGDTVAALDAFDGYLADFPQGRRWQEATYWAARLRLAGGEEDAAQALVSELRERSPVNYYSVQAAALIEQPFTPLGIDVGGLAEAPPQLAERLAVMDEYKAAGLVAAERAARTGITEWARQHSPGALLALAGELIQRGSTIEGINLGWELQEAGLPWNRDLLEVIYPLPYPQMVARAARDRDLDPSLVAALIRQESAFDSDIVSGAGAIGLMQVMPGTGAELARSEGPRGFTRDNLQSPEINLHLGTRFLWDMLRRYERELPLVLSAYNAGPTRANRWKNFPEAADPLRFTERIPFSETRDYVKQVTRNFAMYEALYGSYFRAQ